MPPRVKPGVNPDPIAIRPIRDSDLAAVVALDARTTGESKADYWRAAFDRYVATTDQACAFAAVQGADLVGYVMGEVRSWEFGSPPCGWVFAVNVAPGCRRQRRAGVSRGRNRHEIVRRRRCRVSKSRGKVDSHDGSADGAGSVAMQPVSAMRRC